MSELRKLIDDPSASSFEVSLLASARTDAASAASRNACAAALGVAALGAAGKASAATAATAALWKFGLGALVIVGVVTGGLVYESQRTSDDSPPPLPTAVVTPLPKTKPAAPIPPATPEAVGQAPVVAPPPGPRVVARPKRVASAKPTLAPRPTPEPSPSVEPPPEPSPSVEPPPEPPPSVEPTPNPATSLLSQEIALLDTARSALAAGDLDTASAALANHLARFSRGVLVPESEILRIHVLLRRRQGPAAAALATQFLQRFPNSALVKRARSLLKKAKAM